MNARFTILILSVLLCTSLLIAEEWWEKRPYTEWSERDVNRMLNDSPWVKLSLKDRRWNYRISLLTSRAVRCALLRSFSFSNRASAKLHAGNSVSVAELMRETDGDAERIRLERFIALNPDDIRVRGDGDYIILSVSMTTRNLRWVGRRWWPREDTRPKELSQVRFEDLAEKTQLSTKTGKTIHLVRYEPPGMDMLGAKFYFPRHLPDGSPAVTRGDRELRFETEIDGRKIRAKFDLKKMLYLGYLEI